MGVKDKYPHWKDALFGDDGIVANLRCGTKYVSWHGLHIILATIILGIVLTVKFLETVSETKSCEVAVNKLRSDRVKNVTITVTKGLSAFIVLAFISAGGYLAIKNPFEFLKGIGLFIGILALSLAITLVLMGAYLLVSSRIKPTIERKSRESDRIPSKKDVSSKASEVAEVSKETPVVRRVYGRCPVSFEIEPKWFEKFIDKLGIET